MGRPLFERARDEKCAATKCSNSTSIHHEAHRRQTSDQRYSRFPTQAVLVHDFIIKELGRAVPYGVYDIAANAGWVSVGIDHDTAAFAVNSIRRWWQMLGRVRYPDATRLLPPLQAGAGCRYRGPVLPVAPCSLPESAIRYLQ